MNRLSVRARLTLWYGVSLTVIVVGVGIYVYLMTARHMLSRTDFELDEELEELQVETMLATDEASLLQQLKTRFYYHMGFDFEVYRLDGSVLFRSSRLAARHLSLPVLGTGSTDTQITHLDFWIPDEGPGRIASRVARGPRITVRTQALTSLIKNERELSALGMTLIGILPVVLLAAVGGGSFLAWRAMEPVHRMAATAKLITGSQFTSRILVQNPNDELGYLGKTLNSMMDRLQQAIEELRQFTADAAHELRTPLAVLQTEVEIALRTSRTAEEYRRALEVTLAEAKRLSRLTDQLLQLSRHDSGLQLRRRDEVPFDALLSDITEQLQVLAQQKGVSLEAGPFSEWVVMGDDIQLGQLLLNLIENAIKFTPAGGRVQVTGETQEGHVVVSIHDTGIGITAADLQNLGRRFYRADKSRNSRTGGSGLGLAISKAIVEGHGGTWSIESQIQVGTTVRVSLPLATKANRS